MGVYTSKYTGEEIDNLLGQIENGGEIGGNYTETILYQSSTPVSAGSTIELSDSVINYDQILVESCCDGASSKSICKHTAVINPSSIVYTDGTNETYSVREDSGATSSVSFYRLYYGFVDNETIKMIAIDHKDWKNGRISRIIGIKFEGGSSSGDRTPTGTIISFMGLNAPEGYLICDGAELNIADYSALATHFETQFGTKNHFGGDGTTTFALPDLRNEFLRGYHGEASEQLSGDVGIHQEATKHAIISTNDQGYLFYTTVAPLVDADSLVGQRESLQKISGTNQSSSSTPLHYTSRPTNVAVLYCIKF